MEQLGEPEEFKTIRLRYPGTCVGCAVRIEPGERAHYTPATRTVRCLSCGAPAAASPTAGRSADDEAARARDRAELLARRQAAAERKAAAFAAGAEGERLVAEALAPLSAAGYLLLHDRAAGPRANLDHIVIGPSGVWLVDAKQWSGTVTTEGDELRHNGRKRTQLITRAGEQRRLVEDRLAWDKVRAPVRSAFAFTAAAPASPSTVNGVDMVPVDRLRQLIGGADPVLDGRSVDRAAATLVTALPPASEREAPLDVEAGELPEDLREDSAYVFINPWQRHGERRLYVERCGQGLGYVDLNADRVQVTSDHAKARPTLDFVLEWFADVDAEPRQLGRLRRLAVWMSGGVPRRAVAVRFRRPNVDRLYVHLFDGKRRTQIGYADLLTGRVHAAESEFAPIVAKAVTLRRVR